MRIWYEVRFSWHETPGVCRSCDGVDPTDSLEEALDSYQGIQAAMNGDKRSWLLGEGGYFDLNYDIKIAPHHLHGIFKCTEEEIDVKDNSHG